MYGDGDISSNAPRRTEGAGRINQKAYRFGEARGTLRRQTSQKDIPLTRSPGRPGAGPEAEERVIPNRPGSRAVSGPTHYHK